MDSWISEKHVMLLHGTQIDLQDQKHSLGEELLEWITDWLGDRRPMSTREEAWWQTAANKHGPTPDNCRQNFWRV